MSNVAVFFATGYEEVEALTVVDILRRADIDTKMVSVTGEKQVTSSHKVTVEMDELLENVDFNAIDVLVLPGGLPGTTNLEACEPLMKQVDAFVADGKLVAAICAAPSILGHKGFLKGKKACSSPSFESQLDGAQIVDKPAVIDGDIITGRGMGAAVPFGLAILEKLKGRAAAEKVADAIRYTEEF